MSEEQDHSFCLARMPVLWSFRRFGAAVWGAQPRRLTSLSGIVQEAKEKEKGMREFSLTRPLSLCSAPRCNGPQLTLPPVSLVVYF